MTAEMASNPAGVVEKSQERSMEEGMSQRASEEKAKSGTDEEQRTEESTNGGTLKGVLKFGVEKRGEFFAALQTSFLMTRWLVMNRHLTHSIRPACRPPIQQDILHLVLCKL